MASFPLDPEIRAYAEDLQKKLKERKLEFFHIMADRADFKPIKESSRKELEEKFQKRIQHYKKKLVGEVSVMINIPEHKDDFLFIVSLSISIMTVNKEGKLDMSRDKAWTNRFTFYQEDLRETKITLKLIERLIRLTAKQVVRTDPLGGMRFSRLQKELTRLKVRLEDMDPTTSEKSS